MNAVRATVGWPVITGARQHPRRLAITTADGPGRTYAQLDERTNRLAHALLAHLAPGDRVAIWLGNQVEYIETYLACAKAGLVVVPVNIRFTVEEARHILTDSGARALVFEPAVDERVHALGILDDLALALRVGGPGPAAGDFEEILAAGADTPPPQPDEDTLLVIGYTSGTTGFPKGAELTHRTISHLGLTNALSCRYRTGSVHVFGMSLSFTATVPAHVLPHLAVGGTTVLLDAWDTPRLVDEIERRRADFVILPSPPIPEFLEIVRRDPARVASLGSVLHSASKAPPEHLRALVEVIGPRLVEGWGMTENSGGLITATTERDYLDDRPGIYDSAGRAVPGTVVDVVDADGTPLPHDGTTVGQLVTRSGALARGYWNNPEATASAFHEGWYRTGDLGSVDADGYVTIMDRRSDLIVSGGMNVYPSEIERVLLTAPGVAECAVVAAPHPRWGQTPVAFLVPLPGAHVDVAAVRAHCRTQLASYKVPSSLPVCAELPRNASGKIQRARLAALAAEGTADTGAE